MELGLNRDLANRIVKRIMSTLNHNINVMDENGVIIASGDESRIGQTHKGAIEAINNQSTREIYEDTDTEKQGINKPIFIERKIVGVIGISGHPNEVRKFAELITITAQLMVEQQFYLNVEEVKQTRYRDFLNEWIYQESNHYNEDFILRAELLEIDLFVQRSVALVKMDTIRYNLFENYQRLLAKNEHVMRYGLQNVLLILDANTNVDEKLKTIASKDRNVVYIGVSQANQVLRESVKQAERMGLLLSSHIAKGQIAHFRDYQMIDCIIHSPVSLNLNKYIERINQYEKKGELIETLENYFEYNCEIKRISEAMFIHRNTLAYRIAKIEEITDLNLQEFNDRVTLYYALLCYKYNSWNKKV